MGLKRNISLYTTGNLLPQAASFLLLPIYTRFMTPKDYGIVNSMNVLQTILVILFTFSIERSIYRLYYDYKSEDEKKYFIGSIFITILSFTLIVTLLLYFLNDSLVGVFSDVPFSPWYSVSILTAVATMFSNIPKIHLQVREKAGQFVIISLIQFALNNIFIIYFVVFKNEGAIGMMKAYLFSAATLVPFFIGYTIKISKLNFKMYIIKNALQFSLPLIPGTISAWVLNYTDRIFIEKYFSLSDVGIYSLGNKIGSLVLVFSAAFYKAYNPFFYKMANSSDQEEAKSVLYRTNMLFSLITLVFCFAISFLSKELIVILFDERYEGTYFVVPFIVLGYLISQLNGLTNLFFYQEKKTKFVMNVILIGALISIGLNFILIPAIGPLGAAISFILSNLFMFITQYFTSQKFYFIPFNWPLLFTFFIPFVITNITFDLFCPAMNPFIVLGIKLTVIVFLLLCLYKKYKGLLFKVVG